MKKRGLSLLLALLMVVSVFSPAFPSLGGIVASALGTNSYDVELAFNNLFVFDEWADNDLSTTVIPQDEENPYGELTTDMEAGSVDITILRDADASYGGIYTAHGGDATNPENNANYYSIDVEPNTTYTFSYTLENTNYASFNTIVFYFDDENKFISLDPAGATNLNGNNSWSFTTPANADRIQFRFTVGNTGGTEATGTVKNIVICKSSVLAPKNNLFDVNAWASNEKSGAGVSQYYSNGTVDNTSANDGIILTVGTAGTDLYTNFAYVGDDATDGYYNLSVSQNTHYTFTYTLADCNFANITHIRPIIAYYDATGSFLGYFCHETTVVGENNFSFIPIAGAVYAQIVIAILSPTAGWTATINGISICETQNLFSLKSWSENANNIEPYLGAASGTIATYPATINNTNLTTGSIEINTGDLSALGGIFYTKFDISGTAGAGNSFYTSAVEPNTTYSFYYNLVQSQCTISGNSYFQPWFVIFDENGTMLDYFNYVTPTYGYNRVDIPMPEGAASIQVVFSVHNSNAKCVIKDLVLCPYKDFETITGAPHRDTYTYTYNGDNATYGTLPEANAPDGYVFSGWFTGENGTGERITPDTYVKMNSMSVFAYYEPKVDTLELASEPNKTTYTVGEKLNTAGLSLKATQNYTVDVTDENGNPTGETETKTRTFYINSNIYCTPEYLDTVGTQTITANYGGKTVTFPVTVLAAYSTDIVVNGVVMSGISETNKKYTINAETEPFNRYKITYFTDAYVRGIITFGDDYTEEFFLEPGDNEVFVSFIDNFLADQTRSGIKTIEFTCLNNELGNFQLKAVATDVKTVGEDVIYFENNEYKMGVDIRYGGVVSELYDKSAKNVTARVYEQSFVYNENQPALEKTMTLVDYEEQLNEREDNYTVNGVNHGALTSTGETSNQVNLINTLDRGRYLQQSYYGTSEEPYIQGEFNNSPWKYNPVQGGNVGEEPSKVIDYEITDTYVYIKARPMEWEKWSDDHVDECTHTEPITVAPGVIEYRKMHDEKCYGNDVVSDTYVEAWYYFDDGVIKVNNRKVDYSGLPDAYTQQEMPALYLIEPLNHFVYADVSAAEAWEKNFSDLGDSLKNIEEPEFWGISKDYNDYHYKTGTGENAVVENDKNGDGWYDLFATCNENWAAFTASEDPESFGVGIYTPGATDLYYGMMPQKYAEQYNDDGTITQTDNLNYRHAETVNPSPEMPTTYIAPLKEEWFRSYEATEYTYYLTTGTAEEIRYDFSLIGDKEAAAENAKTKVAVPETVYLNPANNTAGQYYVNNILNETNFYNVETEAVSNDTAMYFGIHVKDAVSFSATVTNATNSSNDIILGKGDGTGSREGETIQLSSTYISRNVADDGFSLRLTNALSPGQKVTARWDITVTLSSGATETHTVYTVLYAPGHTVGAVAEARQVANSQNEISSWITGANGVDHSQNSPLGSFHGDSSASGYFKEDPLVLGYQTLPTIAGTGETANDYINVAADSSGYYVMQTATNGHDDSRSQSYLGLLTVDKSRYTNTNQIPNLRIGYDALRRGEWVKDSIHTFNTYYTLGTIDSFTSTDTSAVPTGWTEHSYTTNLAESNSIPYRETVVPEYDVSEIDGKYIHAITRAQCIQDFTLYITRRYSTAGTSVLCSVTDKSGLRDAVLEGYNKPDADEEYLEKLENAATVLGDPSSSQDEIDKAKQELNEATTVEYYALKYDNIFSAYEFSQHTPNMTVVSSRGTVAYNNGTITVTNAELTDANETYTNYGSTDNYYLVDVKPNTEYVFEYDVTTDGLSQAFMFFYKADGSNADAPTNMFVQTNGGAWASKTESNPWWGNTDKASGKYTIRFTTGPNTVEAGFRFGNSGSAATASTFSNIKLVESSKYYADVAYPATETVHKENTAYGTLPTLTRTGYTFNGWKDANGTAVTGTELATNHLSIYSQWTVHTYTIRFNANGGTGTMSNLTYTYDKAQNLTTNAFTKTNYAFMGWSTSAGGEVVYKDGESLKNLTSENGKVIDLYAVWARPVVNVTFDNLVDISAWSETVTNGTLVNETDTGFTVKTNADVGEAYCSSAYFPIEAGHKYIIEADIKGDGWDVYFFYCNENGSWVNFIDGKNDRMSSNGSGSEFEVDGIHYTSAEFVVPEGAVKGQLRTDANGAGNAVRFENIRVYDVTEKTYLETVNKYVEYGEAYGKLPVPVKEGQQFLGWVDGEGNTVTAASIMDSTSTVYLKSTWTTNPNTVNDDTVIIEYGSPVVINVLSNDKGGTVTGIGTEGVSGSNLGKVSHPSSILSDIANTLSLSYGDVKLNADGTITYTPTKTNVEKETVFYYEATVDGNYYYAKVTVIPATTIYFEDTFFEFTDSTVTKSGKTYNYNWQTLGTSVGEVFQSADRPGKFNFQDDANNVYEYDSMYDGKVSYSGGTAHFVEVDKNAGTAAPTAKFTFTGTGFDLFSVTDSKSGTVTVTIYSGTAVDPAKRVQGIMSNAYFGYSYDSENDSYVASDNGALFQVPVIRARDLNYGTYTVVVQPRYNKSFDVASTGKCGVYVDSVRIFDPMGYSNATANEAYMADGEYAPQFLEIRDTLVLPIKDSNGKFTGEYNVTEITGYNKSVFIDAGKTTMDDFIKSGPKNEVYLAKDNAVAFHIVTDRADLPSTIQLGMKLTGKGGSTATVKLMNTAYNSWVENITLNSTAERYYNIEAVVDWVEQADGTYKTASPVVITNTSDAIVSLTSLKWAFDSEDNAVTALNFMSDEMIPTLANAALMRLANPQITTQQTILNKDNITYGFSGEPYAPGDSGALTIITEQGVSGVTVNGTDVFDCVTNADGKLEWTYEFTAEAVDSMTFEIIARDEEGFTSESVYATTDVENDTTGGSGNDTTEPDDDESDDTTGDSGNNNVVAGPESFVTTLLNGILNIIKKLLGAILGGATV